jgi:hypothetical protein
VEYAIAFLIVLALAALAAAALNALFTRPRRRR